MENKENLTSRLRWLKQTFWCNNDIIKNVLHQWFGILSGPWIFGHFALEKCYQNISKCPLYSPTQPKQSNNIKGNRFYVWSCQSHSDNNQSNTSRMNICSTQSTWDNIVYQSVQSTRDNHLHQLSVSTLGIRQQPFTSAQCEHPWH